MEEILFEKLVNQLQNTSEIATNLDLRRKFYSEFDAIYDYLDKLVLSEEYLKEQHEFKENAYFQNVAEGYFRLGFVEKIFFQYSKLVYELWYEKSINFQRRFKKRLHKGTQIHQIATIYEFFGDFHGAWYYYFAGLIEDAIDGRDMYNSQAYRSLRRFDFPKNNLKSISLEVNKISGVAAFDPLQIVDNLRRNFVIPSYEENESIDSSRLKQATELWEKLLKKKGDNHA